MYLYAVKHPERDEWLLLNGRSAGKWTGDLQPDPGTYSEGVRTGKVCSTLTWDRHFAQTKAREVGGTVDAFQAARMYGDDYREAMGEFD